MVTSKCHTLKSKQRLDLYFCLFSIILISGEYEIAGSLGLYEREHELEKLTLPGPIKEDITIHVSF